MNRIAIIGAGVLGRTLALDLLEAGHQLSIFDPDLETGSRSTGFVAGGMLAPFSEREKGEALNFELGLASLKLWPKLASHLKLSRHFSKKGSLIVAHPRDKALWDEVTGKIRHGIPEENFEVLGKEQLRAELGVKFGQALFIPNEGHVDPREFMKAAYVSLLSAGVTMENRSLTLEDACLDDFDLVVDTRGMGAFKDLEDLRGVRGEAVIVKAPEVKIKRPVRVMHPRYSLYIVPRMNHQFYLGATQIECANTGGITVRSTLELLSAAFSVDSGFAEGEIIETCTGLRPALFSNEPEIRIRNKHISINGLYRHGFLLSPIVSQITCAYIADERPGTLATKIIKVES